LRKNGKVNGNKQRQKAKIKKVGQSSGPLKFTFTWQKSELFNLIKLPGDTIKLSQYFTCSRYALSTRSDLVLNPLGVP
jgi:outer membrane protein assembly factor BamA